MSNPHHRQRWWSLAGTAALALLAACGERPAATDAATPPGPIEIRAERLPLIPQPASVKVGEGRFTLDADTAVIGEGQAATVARQFIDLLGRTTPLKLRDAAAADGAPAIVFALDASAAQSSPEAYSLTVAPEGVRVSAADARGLFYGAVTLWQLLSGEPGDAVSLPALVIDDAPRFGWRGLMLDSARHFQSIDEIKSLIDAMSLHKLNTFHWHLTDDQGWRIEIRKYPKLTEVGGCRIPAGEAGVAGDGQPRRYCGHYTQDQIREVVAYAAERHITVVPEIDVPGHAQAAVSAYPEHGVVDGPTSPSPDWGVNPYLFNPADETLAFLEDILAEVIELFPGRYIHLGGDEAVKHQWKQSPKVQAHMRSLGIASEEAMQSHMLKRLEKYLEDHDRRLIGWDEIIEGGLPPQATVMSWRGIAGGIEAARHGHDVVMAPGSTLYLDFLQTDLPDEPPGRPAFIPLQKIYDFDPVPTELDQAQKKHVIGVQANVWTEHMRLFPRVQHNVFPRLSALAEIAWTPQDRKDYQDFLARLPAQLQRYRALEIPYAQTALSVAMTHHEDRQAGKVTVELSNPLGYDDIRYTTDGSAPTAQSPRYEGPMALALPATLQAAAFFDGRAVASQANAWTLDDASLRSRTDKTLAQCPDSGRLVLRLEDDNPAEGPRETFDVTIFNPCWLWPDADLHGVASVKARIGRIPYNFGLDKDEANRRFRKPVAAHGEFEVRAGCDGPVLATVPLPQDAGADGFVELEAPLKATSPRADLCVTLSGDTRPRMWVLNRLTLQAQ